VSPRGSRPAQRPPPFPPALPGSAQWLLGLGLWWRSERAADAARRIVRGRDATDNPPKRRTLTLLTEAQDEVVRVALALARQVAEEGAGEQSPTGTPASRLLWAVEAAEEALASAGASA
jgi:hypothetical protein